MRPEYVLQISFCIFPRCPLHYAIAMNIFIFFQHLCDELDVCGRALAELDAAVQDFSRRNPLIARQLADAITKLREIHHHTLRLTEYKTVWLKKVR